MNRLDFASDWMERRKAELKSRDARVYSPCECSHCGARFKTQAALGTHLLWAKKQGDDSTCAKTKVVRAAWEKARSSQEEKKKWVSHVSGSGPMPQKNTWRNTVIAKRVIGGETCRAVGCDYGICRGRVLSKLQG